jgi:hypothetical protein
MQGARGGSAAIAGRSSPAASAERSMTMGNGDGQWQWQWQWAMGIVPCYFGKPRRWNGEESGRVQWNGVERRGVPWGALSREQISCSCRLRMPSAE